MAIKGTSTKSDFLPWDSMLLLLQKLENDKEYKFQLLISVGCFTGLRISDLLKLRWIDVLNSETLELVEGKKPWILETKAQQVPEVKTTVGFFRNEVSRDSSASFPRHLPGNNTNFEAMNNQVGYHLVDIEFTQLSLPMPLGLILASVNGRTLSGTPIKFWRMLIESDRLRQGRNHKRKQARELVNPCLFRAAINTFAII